MSLSQTERDMKMTNETNSPAEAVEAAQRLETANNVISALTTVRAEFDSANELFESAATKLYRTLSDIYDQYVVLKKADKKTRDIFNQKVEDMSVTKTKATSLEVLLLRVVANDKLNEQRLKSYAACFKFAYATKSNDDSFACFVMSFGGIDYVRRAATDTVKPAANIDAAKIKFQAVNALGTLTKSATKSFNKNTKSDEAFAVALLRKNADGTFSIVATADSKSAVSATLKYLGRSLTVEDAQKEADAISEKRDAKAKEGMRKLLNQQIAVTAEREAA